MEGISQSLIPSLLATQRPQYDWRDGSSYTFFPYSNTKTVEDELGGSEGEDLWSILPDDLLERILGLLPVMNIFRAGAVCKRWNSITTSKRFFRLCQNTVNSPWYFMYNDSKSAGGLAYDPLAKKWHSFALPCIDTSIWFVASSNGLICFMDNSNGYDLYLCNPITKTWKKLPEPPEKWSSDYYTVSITIDKAAKVQTTVVARSNQVPDDYSRWTLSIEVYDSVSQNWKTRAHTLLHGWRGGENSVICNGFFYCVTHSTAMAGRDSCRHGLITYELSTGVLRMASLGMPCSLTCVKLMNCKEKLVMVGGIGKSDIIKGIGIWELDTEWREVARMPNKYFRGFGEFDDVFSSSGTGDLIYIQAYGSPQLLLYDMAQRSWRWSQKCPMVKKHPLHLFTGFCFEPRFEDFPQNT